MGDRMQLNQITVLPTLRQEERKMRANSIERSSEVTAEHERYSQSEHIRRETVRRQTQEIAHLLLQCNPSL
jgi:hypothetical protein